MQEESKDTKIISFNEYLALNEAAQPADFIPWQQFPLLKKAFDESPDYIQRRYANVANKLANNKQPSDTTWSSFIVSLLQGGVIRGAMGVSDAERNGTFTYPANFSVIERYRDMPQEFNDLAYKITGPSKNLDKAKKFLDKSKTLRPFMASKQKTPTMEIARKALKEFFDIVELCHNKRENLPLEIEKKKEEKKQSDISSGKVAHCQICMGMFKLDSGGKLVHHGFQLQKSGGISYGRTESCFGQGHLPIEKSSDAIVKYIPKLENYRDKLKERLEKIDNAKSVKIKDVVYKKGSKEFEKFVKIDKANVQSDIRHIERDIATLKKRKAEWDKKRKEK